ncbi:hypothetical protein AK812_SmicGene13778 [Symbiodinium microadriaticum]|uniref:Uncharacterized protein n=1 Tax=Symbiodinium microadriaticum TaxID=2951 RepID=A0A1Q9E789_SYMMI|nr:hypothetical protein AK812_SmicGene13778 [Symbiodinium microadriaticum]
MDCADLLSLDCWRPERCAGDWGPPRTCEAATATRSSSTTNCTFGGASQCLECNAVQYSSISSRRRKFGEAAPKKGAGTLVMVREFLSQAEDFRISEIVQGSSVTQTDFTLLRLEQAKGPSSWDHIRESMYRFPARSGAGTYFDQGLRGNILAGIARQCLMKPLMETVASDTVWFRARPLTQLTEFDLERSRMLEVLPSADTGSIGAMTYEAELTGLAAVRLQTLMVLRFDHLRSEGTETTLAQVLANIESDRHWQSEEEFHRVAIMLPLRVNDMLMALPKNGGRTRWVPHAWTSPACPDADAEAPQKNALVRWGQSLEVLAVQLKLLAAALLRLLQHPDQHAAAVQATLRSSLHHCASVSRHEVLPGIRLFMIWSREHGLNEVRQAVGRERCLNFGSSPASAKQEEVDLLSSDRQRALVRSLQVASSLGVPDAAQLAVLNAFCVDIAPASFPESDIASAELRLFHWALARNFPSVEGCGFEEAKANTVPMSKN